ncbi:MAG TPA: hypothetical protein VF861_03670 [Telluria sp.]
MTKFAIILAAAALGGCAVAPEGADRYDSRAYAPRGDQSQWHVVSVTPVPTGTGARAGAAGSSIEYSDAPGYAYASEPRYAPAPVYVAPPLYAPAPSYYYPNYWYPPVSIGLGFSFGRSWGSHGSWGGHRGGHGGGHRRGR